jgi:hypothetical protein
MIRKPVDFSSASSSLPDYTQRIRRLQDIGGKLGV